VKVFDSGPKHRIVERGHLTMMDEPIEIFEKKGAGEDPIAVALCDPDGDPVRRLHDWSVYRGRRNTFREIDPQFTFLRTNALTRG